MDLAAYGLFVDRPAAGFPVSQRAREDRIPILEKELGFTRKSRRRQQDEGDSPKACGKADCQNHPDSPAQGKQNLAQADDTA